MVGQDRLVELIKSFDSSNFPKAVLLVGEEGCGKKTFLNEYIQSLLGKPILDISKSISFDYLMDLSISVDSKICLINVDEISDKQQNILLKFVEEPPENINIVIIATSIVKVIPTLQNRCVKFEFDSYTNDELLKFVSDQIDVDVLQYVRTPGKLLKTNVSSISNMKALSRKLFTDNGRASLANLLTVSDKFNWNGKSPELFDPSIFYDIHIKTCSDLYRDRGVSKFIYDLTSEYINSFKSNFQFDRKRMFEKYLVELKYGNNV